MIGIKMAYAELFQRMKDLCSRFTVNVESHADAQPIQRHAITTHEIAMKRRRREAHQALSTACRACDAHGDPSYVALRCGRDGETVDVAVSRVVKHAIEHGSPHDRWDVRRRGEAKLKLDMRVDLITHCTCGTYSLWSTQHDGRHTARPRLVAFVTAVK